MKNKTLSKILSVFLAVAMVLGSAPLSGFTGIELPDLFSVKAEAYTEGNFYYSVSNSKAILTGCVDTTGGIVIPEKLGGYPVRKIGDSAFSECDRLTSVTIPDSVKIIGSYAFNRCKSLTSITIPDTITRIGTRAFQGCTSLARVYYTGDIESWCNILFDYFDSNPMVYAKDFYINNTLVKKIVIPDTVNEIKNYAFYSFEGITSVTIPDSVTSIGSTAFENCTSLTSVTIPDSVTSIGDYVFYRCTSLRSVTIPDSVTSIGDDAFNSCTSLTTIIIPDSVTSIGEYAFHSCSSLTSVTIPDSVTSISSSAFGSCTSLTSVTIPDSVTSIGSFAFASCTSLTSVIIPDSVTSIGEYAFHNCRSLTSVTIPDSVISIDDRAFSSCRSLTSVTIPDSVISIGEGAFYNCTSLKDVYYNGTEEEWNKLTVESGNDNLLKATIRFFVPNCEHKYSSVVTKVPTCAKVGERTYTCSLCISRYVEFIPALSHIPGEEVTENNTDSTCTENGSYDTVVYCTVCNTEISRVTTVMDVTGHIWGNWVVTLEPTAIKDGRKVRACVVCVEAVQEEVIPKVTNPDIPDEPETDLSVKVNDFTLNYKGTGKINPEINVFGKYTVEYISSDEAVVTVDKDGNVTATGEGTAEITVTVTDANGNTVTDTCRVTVAKAWWQWLIIIFLFGWIWY